MQSGELRKRTSSLDFFAAELGDLDMSFLNMGSLGSTPKDDCFNLDDMPFDPFYDDPSEF